MGWLSLAKRACRQTIGRSAAEILASRGGLPRKNEAAGGSTSCLYTSGSAAKTSHTIHAVHGAVRICTVNIAVQYPSQTLTEQPRGVAVCGGHG